MEWTRSTPAETRLPVMKIDGFTKGDYVRVESVVDDGQVVVAFGTVAQVKRNKLILEDYELIEISASCITSVKVIEP